jgi:mRNA-degrading endonuclease HigB of HigAB toxin-antitoxin module
MYDSYYTIHVQKKGDDEDWYSLRGYLPEHSETKATTLEIAEDLIAKIDYDCKVRIIHVTKNIVETREINKSTLLSRKSLMDLVIDMPILNTAGCCYQVVGIKNCSTSPHDTFTVRNMQTGILTTFVFDRAAIVGDKLQVFNVSGSEYLFTVYKPFTVHKPVKLN